MNVLILANCQVQALVSSLKGIANFKTVIGLPIHLKDTVHFVEPKRKFDEVLASDPNAFVLSFNLSDEFGDLSTKTLRTRCKNFFTITNIHFSGLHPDMSYLSEMGRRVLSPVGDYHSKLVVGSFLSGVSPDECTKLFNDDVFRRLGYYEYFANSTRELLLREESVDMKFARSFLDKATTLPLLFTFNHPTSYCFYEWAVCISEFLSVRYPNNWFGFEPNFLATDVWWPVYPSIAAHFNCRFDGSFNFRLPERLGGRFLSLEEFVHESYLAYADHKEVIAASRQGKEILQLFNSVLTP